MGPHENIGKTLVYHVSEIQVGLVVIVWNDKFIQRFWPTYQRYSAGIDHKLILVRNQGSGSEELDRLLENISNDHEVVEMPNLMGKAWIEGYKRLREKCNYIFFTTDSVWINHEHWLLHAFLSLYSTGAGMASHQYSNGNLRQDFWGAKTEVLDKLNWGTARTLSEWYELARSWEWGDLCFSRQCQNMGYSIVQIGSKGLETVVGGDYEYFLECLDEIPSHVWENEPPNYRVIKFEVMKYLRDQRYSIVVSALSHFPEDELDADLLSILALAHFKRGNIPSALRLWNKAASLASNRKDIQRNLSAASAAERALFIDKMILLEQQNKRDIALSLLRNILEHNPHDIEIIAWSLFLEEGVSNPVKLKNILEKKLSKKLAAEDQVIVERLFGYRELNNRKYEKAHDCFAACLEICTQDYRAMTGLALVELARNNCHQAMEYLQRAKRLCPYSPIIFYTMGTIFEKLNNLKEAMISYQWCLSLMPEYSDAETKLRKLISLREIKDLQEINVDSITHCQMNA